MKQIKNATKTLLIFLMVFGLLLTNLSVLATDVETETYKCKGEFKLLKIDSATGERIKGATFVFSKSEELVSKYPDIKDNQKKSVIVATTDDNGEINLSLDVDWDKESTTWHYKELEADGYVVSEEINKVEIVKNKTTKVIFKNTSLGKLRILKVDPNDIPLNGAKFKIVLLKDGKEVIIEENFVVNGEATIENLVPGIYRIYETKAPVGYVLIPGYQEIEVEPYTKREHIAEVEFVNTPVPPTAGNYASTLIAGLLLASATTLLYISYRATKKRVAR